jgi:hypothetical protein
MASSNLPQKCDILISGTGYFAEIMLGDLAARARTPLHIMVGGRNRERMKWLVEACRARATIYGSPVTFGSIELDSTSTDALLKPLDTLRPRVVVQSASAQSPWKVDNDESDWARLVAQAGFGITIAFHSLLSWRTASAVKKLGLDAHFVNTCYPDGVNQVLAAGGVPITTGVGNIGIFAAVIGGRLTPDQRPHLRVLGHHHHIVQWRKPGTERSGSPVRAWIGDDEIADVDGMTRDVQLPYRDLNLISGASAVPVLLALTGEGRRRAHVPGPGGLGGGYPVTVDEKGVTLDLPSGMSREEAIAWNRQFEAKDGVSVQGGRVVYADHARELLRKYNPAIAEGFAAADVEAAAAELTALRQSLGG